MSPPHPSPRPNAYFVVLWDRGGGQFFSAFSLLRAPVAPWDAHGRGSSRCIFWLQIWLALPACHVRCHTGQSLHRIALIPDSQSSLGYHLVGLCQSAFPGLHHRKRAKRGAGSQPWQFLLLITTSCLALQQDAVCLDALSGMATAATPGMALTHIWFTGVMDQMCIWSITSDLVNTCPPSLLAPRHVICDDVLRSALKKAIFSDGLKLTELEDPDFPECPCKRGSRPSLALSKRGDPV